MNDGKTQQTDFRLADPAQFARNMAKVFEQAAQVARSFAETPPDPQRDVDAQVTPIEQVVKTLGAVAQS